MSFYESARTIAITLLVLCALALATMGGGALVYSRSDSGGSNLAAGTPETDGSPTAGPGGAASLPPGQVPGSVVPGASSGGSGAQVSTGGTTQAPGTPGTAAGDLPAAGGTSNVEVNTAALPPTPQNVKAEAARVCLLGIPAPTRTGGVPSLIEIVPLLGPFSAEAFAMLPALEAAIPAIAPLLPVVEETLTQAQPVLDQLEPLVNGLEQAGFDLLKPLYLPVRDQVLSAEQQVAVVIEPLITELVRLPGAECVPAVEGLLASLLLNANAAKV